MKTLQIVSVTLISAFTLFSCKSEETRNAEKQIKAYEQYVDSITAVAAADAAAKWNEIEVSYQTEKSKTEAAIQNLANKAEYEVNMKKTADKFETYKQSTATEKAKIDANNAKIQFRTSILGRGDFGNDMSFSWVNKDNILKTYDQFVNTVIAHKDHYTVEQWDDIKKLYEALDSRKNTVEKEGLTTADNLKIAGLKVKFAPIFKVERAGSKIEENADAKQ